MRKIMGVALLAAAVLALMTGCGGASSGKLKPDSIPLDKIVSVYIESDAGNITVLPGSGRSIQIEKEYSISAETSDREKLLAQSLLVTTDTSDPSVLTIISRVGGGVEPLESERVRINLTVRIPEGIGSVLIQSSEGRITIDGLKNRSEYQVVNSDGSVTVRDCVFAGSSFITNLTGNVSVNLSDIAAAQEIRINTDTGDINMEVPKTASYEVFIEKYSQKGSSFSNRSKNTRITLSAKVGNVNFKR